MSAYLNHYEHLRAGSLLVDFVPDLHIEDVKSSLIQHKNKFPVIVLSLKASITSIAALCNFIDVYLQKHLVIEHELKKLSFYFFKLK